MLIDMRPQGLLVPSGNGKSDVRLGEHSPNRVVQRGGKGNQGKSILKGQKPKQPSSGKSEAPPPLSGSEGKQKNPTGKVQSKPSGRVNVRRGRVHKAQLNDALNVLAAQAAGAVDAARQNVNPAPAPPPAVPVPAVDLAAVVSGQSKRLTTDAIFQARTRDELRELNLLKHKLYQFCMGERVHSYVPSVQAYVVKGRGWSWGLFVVCTFIILSFVTIVFYCFDIGPWAWRGLFPQASVKMTVYRSGNSDVIFHGYEEIGAVVVLFCAVVAAHIAVRFSSRAKLARRRKAAFACNSLTFDPVNSVYQLPPLSDERAECQKQTELSFIDPLITTVTGHTIDYIYKHKNEDIVGLDYDTCLCELINLQCQCDSSPMKIEGRQISRRNRQWLISAVLLSEITAGQVLLDCQRAYLNPINSLAPSEAIGSTESVDMMWTSANQLVHLYAEIQAILTRRSRQITGVNIPAAISGIVMTDTIDVAAMWLWHTLRARHGPPAVFQFQSPH